MGCGASGVPDGQAALRGGAAGQVSPSGDPQSRSGTWLSLCQRSQGALCTWLCVSCCCCWRAPAWAARPAAAGAWENGCRREQWSLAEPKSKVLDPGSRVPGTPLPPALGCAGSDLRPQPRLAPHLSSRSAEGPLQEALQDSQRWSCTPQGGCLVAVRLLGQDLGCLAPPCPVCSDRLPRRWSREH